jgi:multidrug efflux pump subunit AcrA (membrane-fusion protein)
MIPAAVLVVIALVVLIVVRRGESPQRFRTAPAQLGTVTRTVDVTGTLQPASETDLDFGTSGHVASVTVQAGQRVTAGTVLAALDTTSVAAQLDQSRAALASAEAKLNQDEAGPDNTGEVTAQGAVSSARGAVGPAQTNVSDTHQLREEVVQAAQIALQTALAAAQGQIDSPSSAR